MSDTLLVHGGEIHDGSGGAPIRADVLVRDGRVERVAPGLDVPGARRIDARGCWVTPGFLDTHTHYDAELAVAPGLTESVRHGVTTVVVGCCSVSFVAAAPEDCSDMFTRVEALPRDRVLPLLRDVKTWSDPRGWRNWLARQPIGPNVASFVGHSDLRAAAMGLRRAVDLNTSPTASEQAAMERGLAEALDAGFLGMSSMTNPWDKLDGDREWSKPLPSVFARRHERKRLTSLLRARGFIHQTAPNLVTRVNVVGMVLDSGGIGRKPLKTTLITMMDLKADTYIFRLTSTLAWVANRVLRGDFRWQSIPVPFELYYDGMDSVLFEEFPAGQAIRHLAKDRSARTALLHDPEYRRQFRKELRKKLAPKVWHRDLGDATIVDAPDRRLVGKSFVEVARERSADPVDTFLDLLAEHDTALRWRTVLANHRPDVLEKVIAHPDTLISFADSGAHLRNMAFYNFPLRMLKRVRDAERAGRPFLTTGQAVRRLTGELADWFGLDAGYVREGGRADLVVVDPERLDDRVEGIHVAPFPELGGFERLVNRGDAARSVMIGGVEVARDGAPLAELGRQRTGTFLEARP